ncbi:MAG: hypothetical protein IT221_00265 [Fluviicola sp.]|nr:hypothetical protein [Fluviicola sp.]
MSLQQLPDHSKVWLYQADRALTSTEKEWLQEVLTKFVAEWAAHGTKLAAAGEVVGDYHIVLAVDETAYGASGCSIDTSVRFIKGLGDELGINFFNRLNMLLETEGKLQLVPFLQLSNYPTAQVFNPMIETLKEWRENWKIPVADLKF